MKKLKIIKITIIIIILVIILYITGAINHALNEPIDKLFLKKTYHTINLFRKRTLIKQALENVKKFEWAREKQEKTIKDVGPWMKLSDEELWKLIFGPKVPRSHFVKPYGGCPECGMEMIKYNEKNHSYPALYAWLYDPWEKPFKLWCPNVECGAEFPKNDFQKYYESGIENNGFFNPEKTNKELLFNVEHPDPEDPKHFYGVDDGSLGGWQEWRFIAYYFRVAR